MQLITVYTTRFTHHILLLLARAAMLAPCLVAYALAPSAHLWGRQVSPPTTYGSPTASVPHTIVGTPVSAPSFPPPSSSSTLLTCSPSLRDTTLSTSLMTSKQPDPRRTASQTRASGIPPASPFLVLSCRYSHHHLGGLHMHDDGVRVRLYPLYKPCSARQ